MTVPENKVTEVLGVLSFCRKDQDFKMDEHANTMTNRSLKWSFNALEITNEYDFFCRDIIGGLGKTTLINGESPQPI